MVGFELELAGRIALVQVQLLKLRNGVHQERYILSKINKLGALQPYYTSDSCCIRPELFMYIWDSEASAVLLRHLQPTQRTRPARKPGSKKLVDHVSEVSLNFSHQQLVALVSRQEAAGHYFFGLMIASQRFQSLETRNVNNMCLSRSLPLNAANTERPAEIIVAAIELSSQTKPAR